MTHAPSPIYIGIDPSLTGFALTAIAARSDHFESWVYKSPNKGVERLVDIRDWLNKTASDLEDSGHRIKDIAIESGVYHSQSAAVLGELSATVKLWARGRLGVPSYPLQVPPTSVKKFATDRGNAKKAEVMLSIYRKWQVEFPDDNMADSYVIARICRGSSSTVYEKQVLEKLTAPVFRDPVRV
jgi:Holliday junction resolvasome RuvABC endonuclease subunit